MALRAGFCSVEGDVHLEKGVLLLGHRIPGSTGVEEVYVRPLVKIVKKNAGFVYKKALHLKSCLQFTLLVDFKSWDKVKTWDELERVLKANDEVWEDGRTVFEAYDELGRVVKTKSMLPSPLRVVVTGYDEDGQGLAEYMLSKPIRRTRMDLKSRTASPQLKAVAGWVSAKWSFKWPDTDAVSLVETKAKIRELVTFGHENNLMVRFWDTPEDMSLWSLLLSQGVDLLNTDRIFTLQSFLIGRSIPGLSADEGV